MCDIGDIRPPKTLNNTEKEEENAESKVDEEEQERGGANEETTPELDRQRTRSESAEMDNRDTKTKRASHDPPERVTEDKKATKFRPKRTRSQFLKELEQRQQEEETSTETDVPSKKKLYTTTLENILIGAKKILLSSEDEDMLKCMRTLQIDICKESAIPQKATTSSAAYDFTGKAAVIPAHGLAAVTLNVRLAIPTTRFLLLLSHRGLAKKGVTTLAGVVDSDYRGPLIALLANSTDKNFIVKKGTNGMSRSVCQKVLSTVQQTK